eukprot:CCRYP_000927-RA/>CCRYP_000927-RA protein AED:0.04 eAED:0.04 QI:155/1/1/1/1/1/3/380/537
MISFVLSTLSKAWISIIVAFVVTCLLCFSGGKTTPTVAGSGDPQLRRKLLSLIQFNDPVTSVMKNSHPDAFIAPVEINPDSTISSDLFGIWHNQNLAEVCVRLKEGSRCPHPSLVGRLYGNSITMLEWSQVAPEGSPYTEYCGSYANAWLDPGTYFLEILIIHCNGFGTTALETIRADPNHQGTDVESWLAFDFTYECVEDVAHNRITGTNAFVSITRNYYGTGDKHIGRWELSVPDESVFSPDGFTQQQFTRYQPQGCREKDPDHFLDRCQIPMHNTRLTEVSFFWNRDQTWIEKVQNYQVDFSNQLSFRSSAVYSQKFHAWLKDINYEYESPPICIMGDSHSHHLWKAMARLNLGHRFVMAGLLYPELDDAIFQFKHNYRFFRCTTFIIAAGQWPASKNAWDNEKYGRPFTFDQFRKGMSEIVKSPEIYSIDPNIKIYLRTIHLNPLGDLINDCGLERRPKDWRSPTVIDGYNLVVKGIVDMIKENSPQLRDKVNFIDTRFINNPMWDTSPDFNHVHPQVSDVEAFYIAGKVLVN